MGRKIYRKKGKTIVEYGAITIKTSSLNRHVSHELQKDPSKINPKVLPGLLIEGGKRKKKMAASK